MAVTVSDLASLLQSISISSEPKSGLDELKNVLSTLRIDHIQHADSQLNLMVLFDCLNSSSKEQVETCADVLGRLLSAGRAAANISRYGTQLERALAHPAQPVQLLVLNQVDRCIADEDAMKSLKLNSGFLKSVIACIGSPNSAVAAAAVRAVTGLSSCGQQAALLVFSPPLLQTFTHTLATDDIVRYRCYEVVVNVACLSRENMKLLIDVGLVPELIREAFGRDVLVQLNAVELLTVLANTEHGLEYLEADGVTHKLERMLTAPEDGSVNDYILPGEMVLLPGVMKFFGQLGHSRPDHVLSRYTAFVACVLSMPSETEPTRRLAALDTIACLGMTPAGKLALGRQGVAMTACVTQVGRLAQNAPTETRVRALETIQRLLQLEAGELTDELLALTEAWFTAMSPQPLQLVWSVARQPFLDLRLAALRILAAIATLTWGQRLLFQRAGFLEYLLDRGTETSQEGRDAKYAVVDAVVVSPAGRRHVSADVLAQLTVYHEQGSLYVRAHADVALDQST